MKPYYEDEHVRLFHSKAEAAIPTLLDASVAAVVCDPPYELGFMGKDWDASGIAYSVELWREVLRVLKPGGHLVAFGGTRTYHRMTCAIEDAGLEIRDGKAWIYGSGFPKSLDVSKAIDKAAGVEREVVGTVNYPGREGWANANGERSGEVYGLGIEEARLSKQITAPATAEADRWVGWGTALKPAWEPIVLARKPLSGTVAANVLEHGTGGLNIDGCRVGATVETWPTSRARPNNSRDMHHNYTDGGSTTVRTGEVPPGRWPTNVVLTHAPGCDVMCADGCPVAELDRQSGDARSSGLYGGDGSRRPGEWSTDFGGGHRPSTMYADTGGASRFFPAFRYEAKADASERPKVNGVAHPTVKPVALMRWLVRLVTPPGGTVLDPFAGSGTTLQAARAEGFDCIGVEREADYLPLIRERLERVGSPVNAVGGWPGPKKDTGQASMFDLFGESA